MAKDVVRMYRTIEFKDITEFIVKRYTEQKLVIYASQYRPDELLFKNKDFCITLPRYGLKTNFHESLEAAREFNLERINSKLKRLEAEKIRYLKYAKKFS